MSLDCEKQQANTEKEKKRSQKSQTISIPAYCESGDSLGCWSSARRNLPTRGDKALGWLERTKMAANRWGSLDFLLSNHSMDEPHRPVQAFRRTTACTADRSAIAIMEVGSLLHHHRIQKSRLPGVCVDASGTCRSLGGHVCRELGRCGRQVHLRSRVSQRSNNSLLFVSFLLLNSESRSLCLRVDRRENIDFRTATISRYRGLS